MSRVVAIVLCMSVGACVDERPETGADVDITYNVGSADGAFNRVLTNGLGKTNASAFGGPVNMFNTIADNNQSTVLFVNMHTNGPHANELVPLASFTDGLSDTSAGAQQAIGVQTAVTATKSSPNYQLLSIGFQANVTGGDQNFSFYCNNANDTFRNDGPALLGVTTVTSLTSKAAATIDFATSAAVKLGNQVAPFTIPGSATVNATLGIGAMAYHDGTQITTKNTAANATSGIDIGLDTAINANARGGLFMYRGAGGGFGGTTVAGFLMAGGPQFITDATASDALIFNYNTVNKSIRFSTDSAAKKTDVLIDSEGNLGVAQHGHVRAMCALPMASSCGSVPAISGGDPAFRITTGANAVGCTVTFAASYGSLDPVCIVMPEGGNALPAVTITASSLTLGAGTVAGGRYDVHCWSPG